MNVKVLLLIFALASQAFAGPIAAGICYAGKSIMNFCDFIDFCLMYRNDAIIDQSDFIGFSELNQNFSQLNLFYQHCFQMQTTVNFFDFFQFHCSCFDMRLFNIL